MFVGLVVSVVLAVPPNSLVVVSKRSGVTSARALEVAAAVQKSLAAGGVPVTAVEDASKCNGKKVCLVNLGRSKKAISMVLVEVAAVLDDGLGRVEAISLEEDGRSLGVVTQDGPIGTLAKELSVKAVATLLAPLRALHGVKDPEPVVAPPLVSLEADVPPPMPAPQASSVEVTIERPAGSAASPAPQAGPFLTTPRIIGLGIAAAGAATLIGALVEGIRTNGYTAQAVAVCGGVTPCVDRVGVANQKAAAGQGQATIILSIAGGAALVGGATVFIVDLVTAGKPEVPAVSLVPVAGGAVLGLSGQF